MSANTELDTRHTDSQPEPAAPGRLSHRQILTIMSGLIIAMLLAQLDNMIVSPALPTIVGELGGLEHLSWVTTAYILATTSATLIWGKLGDLFSRKTMFMSSIVIFLIGSALSGQSHTMTELIGFRAIQGIGAGGLMVGVMSIMAVIIPPAERGKYTGYMMSVMPVAMIGGPLVGGFITDHYSWRWTFYVNLPLGAIALAVIALTMKLPVPPRAQATIDWLGAALVVVWTTSLVLVTSWGGTQYAWSSPTIMSLIGLTVVGFVAFLFAESRAAQPILPLDVFRNVNFTLSTTLAFIVGFALFGGMVFLPQFQQYVQGASATNSGLLLLPLMLGVMVMSMASGQIVSRTGKYRVFPIVGSVIMTVGLALMATFAIDTSRTTSAIYMVVLGLGMGCLMQITSLIGQNSVAIKDIGAATGAQTFIRSMGGSIGVSLMGSLYSSRLVASLSEQLPGAGDKLASGGSGTLTPATLHAMPAAVQNAFKVAVTHGITGVFFWSAVASIAGIVVSLFIKQVALRGIEVKQAAHDKSVEQGDGAAALG